MVALYLNPAESPDVLSGDEKSHIQCWSAQKVRCGCPVERRWRGFSHPCEHQDITALFTALKDFTTRSRSALMIGGDGGKLWTL